jgi:hypothetical protein
MVIDANVNAQANHSIGASHANTHTPIATPTPAPAMDTGMDTETELEGLYNSLSVNKGSMDTEMELDGLPANNLSVNPAMLPGGDNFHDVTEAFVRHSNGTYVRTFSCVEQCSDFESNTSAIPNF